MNLLHILAGRFYRLAQGVYTSRMFTQTTRRFLWVAGFLLRSKGQDLPNKSTLCYQSHGLLWLEQTACYDGRKKANWALHQIGLEFLHFIWHGIR